MTAITQNETESGIRALSHDLNDGWYLSIVIMQIQQKLISFMVIVHLEHFMITRNGFNTQPVFGIEHVLFVFFFACRIF